LGPAVHLVPHTHWDREWYLPFQRFRLKLVRLVDRLLDLMEEDERYRFTLDGQLATLDDYLEVRPEAAPRVRRLVEEGRLAIGPWLVLMDEFLVSGETILRNLEYGQRRAEEFGGAMPIGYLPDMFGHVAQMPQLLRLGGIDRAVVWRGVPRAISSHEFDWEAPDGSVVRAEYLPYGYSNGAYLLDVPGRLGRRVGELRESMRPFFGHDPVLAMYGTDHMEPLARLADLVEESGAAVELSTLPEYLDGAAGGARARWRGELRSSGRANMLMGTLSARIDLKAAMARAERALTRYAEPFQARYGTAWPERLLDLAWRRVIECSAHDSICGCSVDEVSAQVLVRCAEAEQIAMGLAEDAAREAAARAPLGTFAAFNPSPCERAGLVELDFAVPDEWEEVVLDADGQRVATQEVRRNEPLVHSERVVGAQVSEWLARRLYGRELFALRLNGLTLEDGRVTFEVDEEDRPIWLDVDELKRELRAATAGDEREWEVRIQARPRRTVVAQVPVPALGWVAAEAVAGGARMENAVHAADRRLDNGLLAVEVDDEGTFALNRSRGVGRLVDGGDEGDSYNYAPPVEDHVVAVPDEAGVELTAPGPVRGELTIVRSYRWSPGAVPVDVKTTVELRAGEPFCRVRVSFENPCGDHRLRFHVPLPRGTASSAAEGQFAVVQRGLEAEAGFGEVALPTFPAYGFVDAGGVAALLDHAMEYELVSGRELALTILRATGLISRSAHRYRESPAGPELAIPDAQCRRPWSIRFALFPHEGDWHEAGVLDQLERYRHPFLIAPGRALDGPKAASGPQLAGEGVVLSSLRRRGRRLEATVACEHPSPVSATFGEAEMDLRAWEIRSVEVP
jgi:glycosyl hydrolase family 38/alpha mannosidase-like protein